MSRSPSAAPSPCGGVDAEAGARAPLSAIFATLFPGILLVSFSDAISGFFVSLESSVYAGGIASFAVFTWPSARPEAVVTVPIMMENGRRKLRNARLHRPPSTLRRYAGRPGLDRPAPSARRSSRRKQGA